MAENRNHRWQTLRVLLCGGFSDIALFCDLYPHDVLDISLRYGYGKKPLQKAYIESVQDYDAGPSNACKKEKKCCF